MEMSVYMLLPVRVSSSSPRSLSSVLRKVENSFCASSTARVNCSNDRPMRFSISSLTSVLVPPMGCSAGSWCKLMAVACSAPSALVRERRTLQRAR
ncbi:hypothetical protein JaAD80_26820 [Janthinobacterium sp. AD80]|nr:hypothetical protein JaAD80_26820 [Janthinobacterium sp. AD80]